LRSPPASSNEAKRTRRSCSHSTHLAVSAGWAFRDCTPMSAHRSSSPWPRDPRCERPHSSLKAGTSKVPQQTVRWVLHLSLRNRADFMNIQPARKPSWSLSWPRIGKPSWCAPSIARRTHCRSGRSNGCATDPSTSWAVTFGRHLTRCTSKAPGPRLTPLAVAARFRLESTSRLRRRIGIC